MASANLVLERCQQAGLDFWLSSRVALELKKELKSKMLPEETDRLIIKKLGEIDSEAVSQFESFHKISVRTSRGTLEGFNRDKITSSLIKETRLPSVIAEEIAREVEEDIRRLQLRNVSAPLIREMVNAKLVARKLLAAKNKYARIGPPVHDVSEKLEKEAPPSPFMLNTVFGRAILQEYILTKVLPPEVTELYLQTDIDIHHLEGFVTCPSSLQNDLRFFLKHGLKLPGVVATGPAKHAEVAASHAARVLTMSRNYAAGGVGFDCFNFFIAPYLRRAKAEQVRHVAQTFLYELNRGYHAPHAFTLNLSTFVPKVLRDQRAIGPAGSSDTYADFEEEAASFLKIFLEMLVAGDASKRQFSWPVVCLTYKNKIDVERLRFRLPKPCFFINQKPFENAGLLYENVLAAKKRRDSYCTGVLQAVSINLPKTAYETRDENKFFEKTGDLIDAVGRIVELKKEIIRKKTDTRLLCFLGQEEAGEKYFDCENTVSHVFFAGAKEAASVLFNGCGEKKVTEFAGRVFRFAKKKLKEQENPIHAGECLKREERFEKYDRRAGICQALSQTLQAGGSEQAEELQPCAPAGIFYTTKDASILKNKKLLFTKLE